jgi:hypothetical protein
MDPKTAQLLIELAHPNRRGLDPADAAAVEAVLRDNPAMAEQVEREEKFNAAVARAMQAVPVPPDLCGLLLDRLAEERGRWYRRFLLRSTAAAAAVVLAVLMIANGSRPRLDPEQLAPIYAAKIQAPEKVVHEWLREKGIDAADPMPFNYALLVDYSMAEFEGRSVPSLLFINHEEKASLRVYVVRARQFDLKRSDAGPMSGGPITVEVRAGPERSGIAFVLVYTNTLDKFLAPREAIALARAA